MTKPGAGAGARGGREEDDDDDVQVLVERPYSHDHPPPPPPRQPGHQQQQQLIRARPYYRRWSPWLVSGATVACVALFLATMYVNDCPRHSSRCAAGFLGRFAFQPLKENPLLGPSSATLVKMGALDVTKVVHGGQGWRLLTCMWLHAGVVHLLINMLCLVLVGVRLEQEFGFLRIGLVYLVSGFGGSLMSGLFIRSTGVVSVGASGALFGLVGSMLSELITNWSLYANKVAALVSLLLVIAVNLALGVLPHVDNFAHIGGLVSGFLLGFVVFVRPHFDWLNHQRRVVVAAAASAGGAGAPPPAATPTPAPAPAPPPVNKRRKHKTYQYVLWVAAAVLLVAGFAAAVVLLFRGYNANDHCSWCHYLSCVPTKHWKCDSSSPTTWCSFNTTVEGGGNTTAASVVCQWGGGRNRTVPLPGAPPDRPEARNDLCKQLCT